MKELLADGVLDHANQISGILFGGLRELQRSSNKITDIRGMGLMIGVDTTFDIKALLSGLQGNGLLATQAGKATLRLTPPLLVSASEAEEALGIIEKTLKEME